MPSSLRVAVVTLGALCFGASATAQQQERTPPQQRVAVERPAAEWAAVERAVERVAAPARPTTPALRIVERTDAGLTIEVRADWAEPLTDAAAAEGPAQLALQSVNGHRTVSEIVALPTLAAPAVEVLAADYDEVPLPQRVDLSGFAGPTAEVVRVGVERRRPTGTFVARLLQADEERNTLRRYRRLVVAVRFAERDRPVAGRGLGGFLRGSDNPHLAVEQSVLAEGQWYKVPVTREGLYRIDRAWLDGLGLDPDGIDPARVQVYGNGGAPLPEKNSTPRIADLAENAVHVVGGGDGRFDSGDAVFFYGAPTHGWRWDPDEAAAGRPGWRHWINLFSVPNYYFVRIGGPPSARVGDPDFANLSGAEVHQSVVGRTFREEDLPEGMIERDGGGSGLDWFGQVLTPARSSAVVLDTIPTGLQGGAVTYRIRVATRTTTRATLEFRSGGAVLGALQPSATIGTTTLGRDAVGVFEGSATSGQPLRVDVSLSEGNAATRGWVDYVEAFFPKALRASDDWLRFHTPGGEAGAFEFVLSGFSGEPQVWDVTDPAAIRRLGVAGSGSAWRVQVAADDPLRPRELVAFTTGSGRVLAPAAGTPVANQNLHGLAFNPDYVIVVPKAFRAAADALAEHRRADGLNPLVVEMDAIYNEFSGGLVDMRAVRDFLRFVYDRAPGEEPTLQHVLLLGDGHYDFRGIKPGGDLNNWVPTYQTENSLSRVYSYTSDDYFGLLDPEEGEWSFPGDSTPDDERLDIGIGRLPVRSLGEAMAVVEKIRRYESPETQGAWRTRYTFVADDQYPNAWDRDLHVQNADVVAGVVNEAFPEVNLQKIYTMTYPRVQTAIGARYPEAVADIHRAIEDGTLVWNYSGHGGSVALADEKILTNEDIQGLFNPDTLPIFVTATCSFGRYDLVDAQSGAELLVLNPEGGGVAALTTVRLVYASSSPDDYNLGLNVELNRWLLSRDASGRPRRIGEAYRLTKASDAGAQGNNRKFNFLGDPAMRVGLPEREVAITAVNGEALPSDGEPPTRAAGGTGLPTLQALERATLSGEVRRTDGSLDAAFNGEVEFLVYDAARGIPIPEPPPGEPSSFEQPCRYLSGQDCTYEVRSDLIYRGRASVTNGAFSAEFIVPRDISYANEPGRIAAYVASGSGLDGLGYTERVVVGGASANPITDTEGPRVRLFLNDTTFVSGGLVGTRPVLVAKLSDENGINAAGAGVGHELLLTLDGPEAEAIDVGRYYRADLDSYRSGVVRYTLPEQTPGPHALTLRAWDVANNSAVASLDYYVEADDRLVLRHVYNYPNPTTGPTRFAFEHNQPVGTPARIQLRIYTLSGRPVRTLDGAETLPEGALTGAVVQIPWDGHDEDFDRLATGVYLYKVRVEVDRPDGTTEVSEQVERLAVIR